MMIDWACPAGPGAADSPRRAVAEPLCKVTSRAGERTSLIVTTNLSGEHWTEVMGGEHPTGALLDRLTHRVHLR